MRQIRTDLQDGDYSVESLLDLIADPMNSHLCRDADKVLDDVIAKGCTCAQVRNGVSVPVRPEPTHAPTEPLAEPVRQKRKYTRRQFGQT